MLAQLSLHESTARSNSSARRHADRTAALWLNRLQDSSTSKRLNLVYLANEVVQQSRARSKTDFLIAFEPLIGEATALAYKNASVEIQNKIRRVVEVWRARTIFDPKIQDALEKRLDEIDKTRGAQKGIGGGAKLGGSLFGGGSAGGVPSELEPLSKSQTALTKAETSARGVVATANSEHAKLTDPNTPLPSPPVHAAKLAAMMKALASAHSAMENSIKARTELIANLEQLLQTHRTSLTTDQATASDLSNRLTPNWPTSSGNTSGPTSTHPSTQTNEQLQRPCQPHTTTTTTMKSHLLLKTVGSTKASASSPPTPSTPTQPKPPA